MADTDWQSVLDRAVRETLAYRGSLEHRPHRPALSYHAMRERFDASLPETGAAPDAMLEELVRLCDPGLMSITGPRFFGWVMGASNLAGVAADWMVAAWGQNTGYQLPTPATAAIEDVVEAWLLDILELPRDARIGITTGATVANAVGLAAARTRVLLDAGWDPDADGLFGAPPVEVLVGADAHSSVFSALQLIGFGYSRVTKLDTDDLGRIRPEALQQALDNGRGPRIVILQAGQINTGAFDDFSELVPMAKAAGAWVHVDGAFGLWARATATHRHLTEGIEGADSWVTDGHKWLQVPYDCGFAVVRDREAHQRAMTQWSSYLPMVAEGDRVPSAYVPELSRRARGVPVWAMLKVLGRQGVRELVERHCGLARQFAERLGTETGVTVITEPVINQLIVEFGTGDGAARKAATEAVIAGVQADGTCFAAGAGWRGRWVMRLSISSDRTTAADIDKSADAIIAVWRAVQAAGRTQAAGEAAGSSPKASASRR